MYVRNHSTYQRTFELVDQTIQEASALPPRQAIDKLLKVLQIVAAIPRYPNREQVFRVIHNAIIHVVDESEENTLQARAFKASSFIVGMLFGIELSRL
jgi:hypothetical protein